MVKHAGLGGIDIPAVGGDVVGLRAVGLGVEGVLVGDGHVADLGGLDLLPLGPDDHVTGGGGVLCEHVGALLVVGPADELVAGVREHVHRDGVNVPEVRRNVVGGGSDGLGVEGVLVGDGHVAELNLLPLRPDRDGISAQGTRALVKHVRSGLVVGPADELIAGVNEPNGTRGIEIPHIVINAIAGLAGPVSVQGVTIHHRDLGGRLRILGLDLLPLGPDDHGAGGGVRRRERVGAVLVVGPADELVVLVREHASLAGVDVPAVGGDAVGDCPGRLGVEGVLVGDANRGDLGSLDLLPLGPDDHGAGGGVRRRERVGAVLVVGPADELVVLVREHASLAGVDVPAVGGDAVGDCPGRLGVEGVLVGDANRGDLGSLDLLPLGPQGYVTRGH